MTQQDILVAVWNAAAKFQDFEWRLTFNGLRTWCWYDHDRVLFKAAPTTDQHEGFMEVACIYCPPGGGLVDRYYQIETFTQALLDEMSESEAERVLTNMALKMLAEMEKNEE